MTDADLFTGGCLCGAIRYRATAAPLRGVICHCELCRRHSGAPCLAFVHFPVSSFEWVGAQPHWYRSSRFAERGFCAVCGITLAMREEVLADRVQICTGTLDDAGAVRIDDHVWTDSRIFWFDVRDELPRFPRSSTAVASKA
jgi:hypothetical protein